MKWYVTCGAFVVMGLSMPSWAFSADNEARQAINELRQQMRVLTDTTQRVNMQMSDRIDMLELEISRLRGMIEEMGGRPAGSGSHASSFSKEVADSAQEQDAYDGAVDLYRQGDTLGAIESLQAFLTLYPHSPLAPTAMFYLGSSQYANKDYKASVATLTEEVATFPDHARSPDALLVLAASQYELNDRAAAKASLQKIVDDYPDSEAASTAADRIKML